MKELMLIIVGSALVNNVVLSQFLGLCPFLGVSKKTETAAGMGGAVIFVITLSSFVTSVIYKFILVPTHMEYLQTIVFILVLILSLVLLVFGDTLSHFILRKLPFLASITQYIINVRTLLSLGTLIFCFTGLYTFVPNRDLSWREQIPGALFSTVCWIGISLGFSIYFRFFNKFSYTYGSLTAVVLLMLWLYFCICALFLGAEINYF